MASQVNYSSNPRSYAHLLAAGVSPAQIREAINSGLNPAQLPPEYFGMSGGFTPQSVGPGSQEGIGGIDFPSASMFDPYKTPFFGSQVGGSMGSGGTISGSGSANVGDPFFGASAGGDWGGLPTVSASGFPIVDYSSGGGMTTSGQIPSGVPMDWPFLPSSEQYRWSAPNYGSTSTSGKPWDFTGTPAPAWSEPEALAGTGSSGSPTVEIPTDPFGGATAGGSAPSPFAGSSAGGGMNNTYDAGDGTVYVYDSDWNYLYTQQSPFAGAEAGGSMGAFAGAEAGGSAGSPKVIPDGTPLAQGDPFQNVSRGGSSLPPPQGFTGGFGVGSGPGYGITGAGFSTGYTPFGGAGSGGSMPGTAGGSGGVGPQFSVGAAPSFAPGSSFQAGGQTFFVDNEGQAYSTRGVDPTGGSSPGPGGAGSVVKPLAVGEAGVRSLDNPRGIAQWDAQQAFSDSLVQQPQYVSGYKWQKNPGWQNTGSQKSGTAPGLTKIHGWWSPVLSLTAPTTPVVPPTGKGKA